MKRLRSLVMKQWKDAPESLETCRQDEKFVNNFVHTPFICQITHATEEVNPEATRRHWVTKEWSVRQYQRSSYYYTAALRLASAHKAIALDVVIRAWISSRLHDTVA